MPRVGNEVFPYTKAGIAAAKAEAREYGKKVVSDKPKQNKKKKGLPKGGPKKKGK